MSSPPSDSDAESSSFSLLDPRIQRWIWEKGWTSLRDAQEQAIASLVEADCDVIIAAATAAGKTEAAFLPILTHMLRHEPDIGSVLYVSPLKALINDQWGRLESLTQDLDIPVIPWHGDITANRKQRFLKDPNGVLLITPESLEALFVLRGHSLPGMFHKLRYIVVDELHAFIGVERGKQLQSLLQRVEVATGHQVPRVGLSATLGDMSLAASFLRPGLATSVKMIVSASAGQELKVLVRGIDEIPPRIPSDTGDISSVIEDVIDGAELVVADHLYTTLRGSNNLVFPNSRRNVELYADLLRRRSEREGVPNEFWPHHGNLSKDIREQTEKALKAGDRAATAICTSTLEMGIDIGSVRTIAQIGPPPSVASLRQRLGRSGRKEGESAILRSYCIESPIDQHSGLSDRLRTGLVQTVAMVRLLLANWFEPPRAHGLHASTLVLQILSLIAERGGITANLAWKLLVEGGAFAAITKYDYLSLLRELGARDLIVQSDDGLLLHGELGEKLVNHYEFYSAFVSQDEFQVVHHGKALGSIPITRPLLPDSRIIFAGRRWRVEHVDSERKILSVLPDPGGVPPMFDSGGAMVHDRVRSEMRKVLSSTEPISFLDARAKTLLDEARKYYRDAQLGTRTMLTDGSDTLLFTWKGDWVNDALMLLLQLRGFRSTNEGVVISVTGEPDRVLDALDEIARLEEPEIDELLAQAQNIIREKWDWALPPTLLRKSYASSWLDLRGCCATAKELCVTK